MIYLTDLERFKVLIYEYLFHEEARCDEAVSAARYQLNFNDYDSYYILRYYEAVRRREDFKSFMRSLCELLKYNS